MYTLPVQEVRVHAKFAGAFGHGHALLRIISGTTALTSPTTDSYEAASYNILRCHAPKVIISRPSNKLTKWTYFGLKFQCSHVFWGTHASAGLLLCSTSAGEGTASRPPNRVALSGLQHFLKRRMPCDYFFTLGSCDSASRKSACGFFAVDLRNSDSRLERHEASNYCGSIGNKGAVLLCSDEAFGSKGVSPSDHWAPAWPDLSRILQMHYNKQITDYQKTVMEAEVCMCLAHAKQSYGVIIVIVIIIIIMIMIVVMKSKDAGRSLVNVEVRL
eukprot:1969707-Amphidinium_carterae.2